MPQRLLGFSIDLSQLSQVSEPLYFKEDPYEDSVGDHVKHLVGFCYRIGSSDSIAWSRRLRVGPPRVDIVSNTLKTPADALLQVGEEMFYVEPPRDVIFRPRAHVIKIDKIPVAVLNLGRDINNLISAWTEWKTWSYKNVNR